MEGVGRGSGYSSSNSKIGLAFSSGFFGFFAHAGFLAAIRDVEIAPTAYSGASSGAIIAAMAACEMSDQAIAEILFALRKEDFWDPDPWYVILRKALGFFRGYTGYLNGKGFERLLENIPERRIENCEKPLAIAATNLTERKEAIFSRGDLIKAVQASGAVPILFKPVEIAGSLYVDGGVSNKCPLKALADLVELDTIIVHFIASENVGRRGNEFLGKKMTPWHIQCISVNIARHEAYRRQLELVRMRDVEVLEVRTDVPALGPNKLKQGRAAYDGAKAATLKTLKGKFPLHLKSSS